MQETPVLFVAFSMTLACERVSMSLRAVSRDCVSLEPRNLKYDNIFEIFG